MTTDDKVRFGAELSPDGRQVAYAMTSGDVLNQTRAIYVSNRDGSGRVELTTPGTNFVGNLKWSPEGKRIAYSFQDRNDTTGTPQAFVVEIARPGAPKRVGTGSPLMWLDGDRVLLTNIAGSRVATVSSGTDALLYRDSTVGFPVKGETHMFYRDYRAGRLGRWIVRIDKDSNPVGEPRKLMEFPPIAISTTRDYVITLEGQSLWRVMLPSGQRQSIRNTFTGLTDRSGFTINPVTQEIVYTVFRDRAKLVMMENPFK
jgi:dipeptidyl aminopeptidase/acylaminoacyl peptidase